MWKQLAAAAVLAFGAAGIFAASVSVITFDDIPSEKSGIPELLGYDEIPDGYAGFNWSNIWVTDGTVPYSSWMVPEIKSGPNAAFLSGYLGSGSFYSSVPFKLTSIFLGYTGDYGRYEECLYVGPPCAPIQGHVGIDGFRGETKVHDLTVPITPGARMSIDTIDWRDYLTKVRISFVDGNTDEFGFLSFDDVRVSTAPLPAAALLLASGLLGMLGLRRKNQPA